MPSGILRAACDKDCLFRYVRSTISVGDNNRSVCTCVRKNQITLEYYPNNYGNRDDVIVVRSLPIYRPLLKVSLFLRFILTVFLGIAEPPIHTQYIH